MQRLCERLEITPSIKIVNGESIQDVIKIVFKNECYKFYLNSELIDVNNRFRIFKYQNKTYIAKKTTKNDGELEIKLAHKAMAKLEGITIDNYKIRIVKPNIYYVDGSTYILTEYMGNSLQEIIYSNLFKNSISLNTILNILELLLKKRVLYRGFLPRNMVVDKKNIYLLDWEDAIFDNNIETGINLLWKTNFILNWSYFYDFDKLEKALDKYCILNSYEPPLLKYEEKFKSIANLDYTIIDLRKCILNTVIESEQKINEVSSNFIIPPNDMAHLVSDLYNSDIDVLFDISSSVLRRKSETKYIELLKELSEVIVESYSKKENISKNSISIIFKFLTVAAGCNVHYTLITNSKEMFFNKTKEVLDKLIYNFNKTKISEENFIRIANYIYSYK